MSKKDKDHLDETAAARQDGAQQQPASPDQAAANAAEAGAAGQNAAPESYTLTAEEFSKVQQHIADLQKEKDETVALLQRTMADFDNFRKRNASVRRDSFDEGVRSAVSELLPMLDNFSVALQMGAGAPESWRSGVEMVYRQFGAALEKLGVTEVDASGKFDPRLHNAVFREKAEGREEGDILEVLQKGYRMGETILRHSIVKVAE